jgi:low affinity Fe/Cu permease
MPESARDVDEHVGLFDRFAEAASLFVSRAPFFAGCVIFVALWIVQGVIKVSQSGLAGFTDTAYQLEINTTTTIITFLMVAILQNSQTRAINAIQKKLNAMADAQADLLMYLARKEETDACQQLVDDAKELRAAVGLEDREST